METETKFLILEKMTYQKISKYEFEYLKYQTEVKLPNTETSKPKVLKKVS